jgi:hypothetical protein
MFSLNRSAASFAFLAVLAAGCGSVAHSGPGNTPDHDPMRSHSMHHPMKPATPAPVVTQPPAQAPPPAATTPPQAPPPPANPIPQHNGGDSDGDNNGGPSDGDGNI